MINDFWKIMGLGFDQFAYVFVCLMIAVLIGIICTMMIMLMGWWFFVIPIFLLVGFVSSFILGFIQLRKDKNNGRLSV